MNTAKKFTGFEIITVGFMAAWCAQPAHAGWSGAMNGIGYGQAAVNVRAYDTLASKTKYLSTPNTNGPSAALAVNTAGYYFGARLPADASSATEAKINGYPGYIWEATTVGNNGDSTDHTELDNHIKVDATVVCASLVVTSSVPSYDPQTKSGTVAINAVGTGGTAFRARGFELVNGGTPPEDDPLTPEINEFLDFLKANGVVRWDIAMAGPFADQNCSTVTIPFTIQTVQENLYFVSDGMAKSLNIIECPADVIVQCGQPVLAYPVPKVSDGVQYKYNPELREYPGGIFPMGVTPVTVTATDANGCEASCTFNVVNALSFNGFYPPLSTFNDGTCQAPARIVKLGNKLPVKFDVSCNGYPVTTGHPRMSIEKPSGNCDSELEPVLSGEFQLVGQEWHFNWETGTGGVTAGPHKLTTTLQDGTQRYVWVKLK